jgi:hypothetical protein
MVRYVGRNALVWLLNMMLVIVLSLSLPPVWSSQSFHGNGQETESYESERYERKSMPPARLKHYNGVIIPAFKPSLLGNTLPAPEDVILPVLCILFCPLIYKLLLRLWLEPLKFTSNFVAVQHLSLVPNNVIKFAA